jgi:SAM-dependent methyltransferase
MAASGQTTAGVNGTLWGSRANDWAELQECQCLPVYVAALDRLGVGAGTRYLDAGCGAGGAVRIAADRGAQVTGFDASQALLAIARQRVPGAVFLQGDLEKLPFGDGAFDVVTGFNSFQYAGNATGALAEARRVLKAGGLVAIATWGPPESMPAAELVAALRPLLPAPPPGAPGPFALSNEATLRSFAAAAGLDPIEVFDVESPFRYSGIEEGVRGLGSSGISERARKQSGEEAVDSAHRAALARFLQNDGSCRVHATFRCLIARA